MEIFEIAAVKHEVFSFLQVPLVPLVPGLSILMNVFLMLKLSPLTWVRFAIWIAIGNRMCRITQHNRMNS